MQVFNYYQHCLRREILKFILTFFIFYKGKHIRKENQPSPFWNSTMQTNAKNPEKTISLDKSMQTNAKNPEIPISLDIF